MEPTAAIDAAADPFADGLSVLRRLTGGMLYVCTAPKLTVPVMFASVKGVLDGLNLDEDQILMGDSGP